MKEKNNLRLSSLIQHLVDEVQKESASISERSLFREGQESSGGRSSKESSPSYRETLRAFEKRRGRPLLFPYLGSGLGRGPYVQLQDGSVKLDLIGGIGVHILGHSHPVLIKAAIEASLSDIVMQGNLQCNQELIQLSDKLLELAKRKSSLSHVWMTTSGAMANENALKICRQKRKGARKILAMKAAFAGRSTLMTEISDNPLLREGLPSYKEEVLRVPFYDRQDSRSTELSLDVLKQHVDQNEEDICAFMFECVQGEGGIRLAPRDYFLPLLEFCKSQSIPIWADEVQTFCRTGHFFAFETLEIGSFIDVCTVSKALQNGATLFSKELNPSSGLLGGTFVGSSSSLAVGYQILDFLDRGDFMGEGGVTSRLFHQFKRSLETLSQGSCRGLVEDIDGVGLMIAFTPLGGSKEKVKKLLDTLFKNGLMAFSCGRNPYRVRFLLPAIMTLNDISVAEQIIERSLLEVG